MCFLLSLGRFILVPILSEWLVLEDFLHLDSSLCCHIYRQSFLQLIINYANKYEPLILRHPTTLSMSNSIVNWLISRNFKCDVLYKLRLDNIHIMKDSTLYYLRNLRCLEVKGKLKAYCKEYKNRLLSQFVELNELHCDNDSILKHLMKYANKLKMVEITLREQKEQLLCILLRTNPLIQSLNVKAICSDSHSTRFSSWFLKSVAVHGRNVNTLHLNQIGDIKSRNLLICSLHCNRDLTELSYNGFNELSLRTILWYKGSQLLHLNLQFCSVLTDCLLEEVVSLCPTLTALNLSYCSLTDASIVTIVNGLQCLSQLWLYGVNKLSNASLIAISESKLLLSLLSFKYTYNFRKEGLQLIGSSIATNGLRTLSLVDMLLKSNFSVLPAIISQCHQLTDLDISNNVNLGDKIIDSFVFKLNRNLLILNLGKCPITDLTLNQIADNLIYLNRLNVNNCCFITDNGLLVLVFKCKKLRWLNVTYTTIGEKCIKKLKRLNKQLEIECQCKDHLI